jgi:hypothetical protein
MADCVHPARKPDLSRHSRPTSTEVEISQAAAFYEYGEKVIFQAQIQPVDEISIFSCLSNQQGKAPASNR